MVARGADGVYRTEATTSPPLESNGGGQVPARVPIEDFDWNKWLNDWLDHERGVMIPYYEKMLTAYNEELFETIAPRLRKIGELELEVAQLRGAIDVLRGRGVPGALNIRDTYDSLTAYGHLDVVALNGGSFIALKDAPGPCPGPDWQLLASAGKRGERGARGQQGDRGVDGAALASISFDANRMSFATRLSDGAPGPEISLKHVFAGVDVDPATYSVSFQLLDGSELKFSLRALFAQFFDEVKGR